MASSRYTKEQAVEAISKSRSWKEVLEKLGLKDAGGNARTIKKIALKNNVDTSHFLGQGWSLGKDAINAISVENAFVKNSTLSKNSIKKKIIKFGLIKYICQKCGVANMWQGSSLVLHLDHINGDSKDNRIENLRYLCPNCHSQTPTYCRNGLLLMSKGDKTFRSFLCSNCGKAICDNKTGMCRSCWGHKKITIDDLVVTVDVLRDKIKRQKMEDVCNDIGIKVGVLRRICRENNVIIPNFKSLSVESKVMAIERSRKFHVDKEHLENMLRTQSLLQIGRLFGVSDNAIRKRCKNMGIDYKSISKFSHDKYNARAGMV